MGMIGSDDVLACFIAGNVFTWDDWFRLETEDDSLQPTIDMLLNVSVFMWYGAVCPWHKFVSNEVIHIFRLIPLGIMVLLFRRLPMVLTYHKFRLIHQIEEIRHALFVGFFGPIGVSAIFYLYIAREFLAAIQVAEHERGDAERLGEVIEVVVWFLVICSIVVHGLSIPLGKLGFYLPRTIGTAMSTERVSASQSLARAHPEDLEMSGPRPDGEEPSLPHFHRRPESNERGPPSSSPTSIAWLPRSLVRAGKHIYDDIKRPHGHMSHVAKTDNGKGQESDSSAATGSDNGGTHPEISMPRNPRPIGHAITDEPPLTVNVENADADKAGESDAFALGPQSPGSGSATPTSDGRHLRRIQFADEPSGLRSAPARSPRAQSPVDTKQRNSG